MSSMSNPMPLTNLAKPVIPCYTVCMGFQIINGDKPIEINGHIITKENNLWKVTRIGDTTPIIFFHTPVEAMEYAENAGFKFLEETLFSGGAK